jgi:hypothetical protein
MTTESEQSAGRIIHEIHWSEALPWWLLFRAAGAAFSPTVILLAALGALATWAGWSVADSLGLSGGEATQRAVEEATSVGLPASGLSPSAYARPALQAAAGWLPEAGGDVLRLVSIPFRPTATLGEVGGALTRIGWFVLVWAMFGTAITRHVALALVGEESPGLIGGLRFGSQHWLAAFNAVAFVLAGILALSIPGALLGLLMRTDIGLAVAGAIWPLVLAGAVVLAILAIGVIAAWPLMVATVGVERGDSFQAISTAFSYFYQRPLHVAFYGFVALIVAVPAFAAAGVLADATGTLALWAASFGMGHERTVAVVEGLQSCTIGSGCGRPWGVQALAFWSRGLEWLLGSFGWGYFWSIATAAYFLLRQDVDGTEFDEVVLDEEAS